MKPYFKIILIVVIGISYNSMNGKNHDEILIDSLKSSHQISFFGEGDVPDKDSVRALVDMFYLDQFRHFQDPRAPYFLFMSKDSKFAMGIGGVVRMRGWYDWGGVIEENGFIPYSIAIPRNEINRQKIASTPAGSALFFKVIGRNHRLGDYQIYIEANFNGYQARDFHLKKAYATINDWTIGYAMSSFSDPVTNPPTLDAQGPSARVQTTAVLVRWMHNFNKNWTGAASLEMPNSQIDGNNTTTMACDDRLPNLAVFGQYSWNKSDHVRLSGILRNMTYRNLLIQQNKNELGWGLQLSSIWHPTKQLVLYATVNGGQGYGSFTGDLIMGNFDLINNPNRPGEMYTPSSIAWFGAAQYYIKNNLFVSMTLGQERFLPQHHVSPTTYKYGLYSAYNVFWDITPRVQVAAELNLGKRMNFDGHHNYARRFCLMAQFSF